MDARPLSSAAGNPLRWRSPKSADQGEVAASPEQMPVRAATVQFASHPQRTAAREGGWNISRAGTPAKFVQTDGVQDPFGNVLPANEEELPPPLIAPTVPRRATSVLRQPMQPPREPAIPPAPEVPAPDDNQQPSQSDREATDVLPPPQTVTRIAPRKSNRPDCESVPGRPFSCPTREGLACLPENFLDISPPSTDLRLINQIGRGEVAISRNEDVLEKVLRPAPQPSKQRAELLKSDRRWKLPKYWELPAVAADEEIQFFRLEGTLVEWDAEKVVIDGLLWLNTIPKGLERPKQEDQRVIARESPSRVTIPRQNLNDDDEAFVRIFESRVYRTRSGRRVAEGFVGPLKDGRVTIVDAADRPLGEVALADLAGDNLNTVAQYYQLPSECLVQQFDTQLRSWTPATFAYTASALAHKPLYFEQPQVERYGHSTGPLLQPLLSGSRFFVDAAFLPYKMAINPPGECQYSLGYYRPGSCAPYMIPPFPLSVRGAIAQAGVVVGGIYIIP